MALSDETGKVVPFQNDNDDADEVEKGTCFVIMRGARQTMTLDFKIPVREGVWRKRGFPYTSFDEYEHTPDGIEILTDRGVIIVIEGDDLDRLYDEIGNHRLRLVRPAEEGEEVENGEPRPNKIIFIEPKSDEEIEAEETDDESEE